MTISAPLRPGMPNGEAAGPVRNDTIPSLTGQSGRGRRRLLRLSRDRSGRDGKTGQPPSN